MHGTALTFELAYPNGTWVPVFEDMFALEINKNQF